MKSAFITLPDLAPMYDAVGKGISLFATVELQVGFAFEAMLKPAHRPSAIAVLNSARSFEAKMKMIDALADEELSGADLKRWRNLSSKIGRRKDIRDKLAHWMVAHWPAPQSAADLKKIRPALVPPIWKAEHAEVMWMTQRECKTRPLFLRDLEEYGRKAVELANELSIFSTEISAKNRA